MEQSDWLSLVIGPLAFTWLLKRPQPINFKFSRPFEPAFNSDWSLILVCARYDCPLQISLLLFWLPFNHRKTSGNKSNDPVITNCIFFTHFSRGRTPWEVNQRPRRHSCGQTKSTAAAMHEKTTLGIKSVPIVHNPWLQRIRWKNSRSQSARFPVSLYSKNWHSWV